ncbi:MAG: hypothetical protein WD775_04130, partial [Burkholderiales bacterium]
YWPPKPRVVGSNPAGRATLAPMFELTETRKALQQKYGGAARGYLEAARTIEACHSCHPR